MRDDLAWRATGLALFAGACGVSRLTAVMDVSRSLESGLSLMRFCLAIAGVMLLVSGRRWLDRMGGAGATPVVRSRTRRRVSGASSPSSASRAQHS